MNVEIYPYSSSHSYLDFTFDSQGPKGRIRKIIRYIPRNSGGTTYFNLGFGDLNQKTGRIDDLAISNNQDRGKILATIAATVLEFALHFPDAMVYAKGSIAARTRLYQIGISKTWDSIEPLLYVYGYVANKGWQPFRRHVNYEAFLTKRK